MKNNKILMLTVLGGALVCAFLTVGCSKSTEDTPPPAPIITSVLVSPAAPNVGKGGEEQLSATVTGENDPPQTVEWSIHTAYTDPRTTVSPDGLLTLSPAEVTKEIQVMAVSTVDSSKSGVAYITVDPSINADIISGSAFVAELPSELSAVKSSEPLVKSSDPITTDGKFYGVEDAAGINPGGVIAAFRAAGGKEIAWDHNNDWVIESNVRADISLEVGAEDNAFLLFNDEEYTYDLIKTGFFREYMGSEITDLGRVKLYFGATAEGTYKFRIVVRKVSPETGAAGSILAQQVFTFTATRETKASPY
ncbi:MAG: hypothetical protein LBT01_04295 [Spirochaetaceae bacterium]|jgi:hypothetical protein|nr:hypothetical protein [Spirochaetaceae bacterium]